MVSRNRFGHGDQEVPVETRELAELPPRVLYVTDLQPSEKLGSLETMIFSLASEFKARGSLFIPVFGGAISQAVAGEYASAGLRAESLDLYRFKIGNLRKLLQTIRKNRIEIIDWNFYPPLNVYFLLLSLLAPYVRHFITNHNSRTPAQTKLRSGLAAHLKRLMLKRYDRVLCISDFVLEALKRESVWSNLKRCHFFIDTTRFKPDRAVRRTLRADLNSENNFVILLVAHLIRWKGVDVAIRALKQLPDSVSLWVVGGGEEAHNLQVLTGELKLTGRVTFLGNQRNVEGFMQAADCLVCPSIWQEAMGFVILEGSACQLPIVASRIGGIPEFVIDGETGLLFKAGSSEELADNLKKLQDPNVRERLGDNARAFALNEFSKDSKLSSYLDLYRQD
jgi:glycosyltransferase involved in cell wall biosynthesis